MDRKDLGIVNAYILNLMSHSGNHRMDEYELRDRIEKRYNHSGKRIRPQNVRKFHLEPLAKKRWLRSLPDGRYERIGELRLVKPRDTLFDQFAGLPEEYLDSYVYDKEFNRNLFGSDDYEGSLTEKEYGEYMEKLYRD